MHPRAEDQGSYWAEVIRTFKEVATFVTSKLSTLDTVTGTQTSYVLKKYKDHGTILEKPEEDKREMITP